MVLITRFQNAVNYWRGHWRMWWRLCPKCNCDAPECDRCNICKGSRERPSGDLLIRWGRRWESEVVVCEMINLSEQLTVKDMRQMADYLTSLANLIEIK